MKHARHAGALSLHLCFLVLAALLLWSSAGLLNPGPTVNDAQHIATMEASVEGGPFRQVQLPHNFSPLSGRTPVTLTAVITPGPEDAVYIRSIYAPAAVYLDDVLCFEFGREDSYPDFMEDPGTEVHMVETHGKGEEMVLRIEYLSPLSQPTLTVQPPILGSAKEIILERFHALSLPFLLSLAQIVYGLSLIFISVCLLFADRKSISFLWLGLLSLSAGLWVFGESEFSTVVFKNSTFLYLITFISFFAFTIPLLRFTRCVIEFEDPRPIAITEYFMEGGAVLALALQLTGLLSFIRSMYFFFILVPVVLVLLTVYTILEFVRHKNVNAGRFILPVSVQALASILELINYRFSILHRFALVSQLGNIIFLLMVGVTAGLSVKDSIGLRARQKELAFDRELMDITIKEQESRSRLLAQHESLLRQQRHDLRHHLNVIQGLAGPQNRELQDYLRTLMEAIPSAARRFCENEAVNALLSHYHAICQQKDIQLTMHLAIPAHNPHLSDSALCVILGNLLENAVEACDRMGSGERFIRLNSRLQYDLLTITMDNSFNGELKTEGQRFRSSKRNAFGIGLSSVQSVARKAGGDGEFHTSGNVFLSSVYVHL